MTEKLTEWCGASGQWRHGDGAISHQHSINCGLQNDIDALHDEIIQIWEKLIELKKDTRYKH
jgi:hypothetical protein